MSKLKDLTGGIYGDWTVISRADDHISPSGFKFVKWLCRCKCGTLDYILSSNLTRGISTRCKKCVYHFKDLTGLKFGLLTIIKRQDKCVSGRKVIAWICTCDCGNESWVVGGALTSKKPIRSCGCIQKEIMKNRVKKDRISHLISIVYKDYKTNAKKRGLCFDLTIDELTQCINKPCRYCGDIYSNEKKDIIWGDKKTYLCSDSILKYNGIDRVDNNVGYTYSNCVPCCCVCNKMKINYTVDVFLNHINKILNHLNEEKPIN